MKHSFKAVFVRFFKAILIVLIALFASNSVFAQTQTTTDELLALQYYNNQEYDKAIVLYEKLFNRNPSIYLYNYYFECLIALEDYKKAERLTSGLIKKNPAVFRYQVDEGYVYLKTGNQKKHIKSMQAAINNLSPTVDNYMALAQYFEIRGLKDWSTKTYEKAIEQFPYNEVFSYELIYLYYDNNQLEDMFEQIFKVIDNPASQIENLQERLQAIVATDHTEQLLNKFIQYVLRRVQRKPQNIAYADILLWAYIQNSDFERAMTQAIAMDKRQNREGEIIIDIVPTFIENKEYAEAVRGINYIITLGSKASYYYNAKILLIDIKYLQATSTIPPSIEILKEIENDILMLIDEMGIQLNSISLVQKLAEIQAYYLNKPLEAKKWIDKAMQVPRLQAQLVAVLKIQKADIMLMTGEHWDASLLYSQVEKDFKHDTIGFYAKFKNAKFYYYIGEFEYAQTHLKILQGSTSKLIANDAMDLNLFIINNVDTDSSFVPLEYYSRAEFMYVTKKHEQSLQVLDSLLNIFPYHPIRDDALMLKSKILIFKEEYEKAAQSLHQILANHYIDLLADDALYILAGLYKDKLDNPDNAMDLYWQIVDDFPSSVYAQEARELYRQIRNKNLQ